MSDNDPYAAPEAELGVAPPEPAPPTEKLNPWFAIWARPRAVMRQLMWSHPEGTVLMLAALQGIVDMVSQSTFAAGNADMAWLKVFFAVLVTGPLAGLLLLYLGAFLLRVTGRWLGGEGTSVNIRAAWAYSSIPVVWGMLLWIPGFAIFGEELFLLETPRINASPFLYNSWLAFAGLWAVIDVWAFVVFLKCLAEVQYFSAWRALANAFLAVMIMLFPLVGLVVAFSGVVSLS